MSEMDRKAFLGLGVAAVGVALGGAVLAPHQAAAAPVSDEDDSDQSSDPASIARRLNKVGSILEKANLRLDSIVAAIDPGPPNTPPVVMALQSIIDNATRIVMKATMVLTPNTPP